MTSPVFPDTVDSDELARFEAGCFELARFTHAEHVRMGHALVACYPFSEAAFRFSSGLREMARKGERANLYHETITVGFLSLIAERHIHNPVPFEAFRQANPDLFSKLALAPYYSPERLGSAAARHTFLLPDLSCR
jgi:hypothetical protein